MYTSGQGVRRDPKEAVRWFRKVANQGDGVAQYNLSLRYQDSEGVRQDFVMAYVWLNVAVDNGRGYAKDYRDKARAKLNASERKLGRKLSKPCFKKPVKCPEYSDD